MKIILAEDDPFFQKFYTNQLEKFGLEVVLAQNGEEALEKIQEENPILILLDLIMPKKDGFEVLKTLQSNPGLSKAPIIVFSTLREQDNIAEAKKLGATDFIDKSTVSINELHDKIVKYIPLPQPQPNQ